MGFLLNVSDIQQGLSKSPCWKLSLFLALCDLWELLRLQLLAVVLFLEVFLPKIIDRWVFSQRIKGTPVLTPVYLPASGTLPYESSPLLPSELFSLSPQFSNIAGLCLSSPALCHVLEIASSPENLSKIELTLFPPLRNHVLFCLCPISENRCFLLLSTFLVVYDRRVILELIIPSWPEVTFADFLY